MLGCVCGVVHIHAKGRMYYRKSGRAQTHWKAQMPGEDFCIVMEVRECGKNEKETMHGCKGCSLG